MNKSVRGFTIVELLIVIVIIAVLAVISIVAYRGVTDRANDSAAQADMTSFAKKMELFKIDNNNLYPASSADLTNASVKLSGGIYDTTNYTKNAVVCTTSGQAYAFLVMNKSGHPFVITNTNRQPQPYTATTWNSNTGGVALCTALGGLFTSAAASVGYSSTASPQWSTWTNYTP